MEVTMNVFAMAGMVILAVVVGYFWGKYNSYQEGDEAEAKAGVSGRRIVSGKSIFSPVAGRVASLCEEEGKGVSIEPEQGQVYAPISGKITKLYPMGNAMCLQSMEQGDTVELMIRVGKEQPDELCCEYFCPRIVQNEIVAKGKLLLIFDKERLLDAGEDISVYVTQKKGLGERDVAVGQKETVKVGEELFRICQ